MKKIFLSILMAVSLAASVTANDNNDVKVNSAVLSSFKNDFRYNTGATWTRSGSIYIARFTQSDGNYQAYYTADGSLLGFLNNATISEMPKEVKKTLNKRFSSADIISASKLYSPAAGLSFVIILSENDQRKIVQVDREGSVELVRKIK